MIDKNILLSSDVLSMIKFAKEKQLKIGFACGVFDLFHAGHVLMLKECKEHCDFLVIAINKAENIDTKINPNKKKPLFSFAERKLIMENSRYVDLVLGYHSEEELLFLLQNLPLDVRFLGDDYNGKAITGANLKLPIHYTDRSHGLSTSLYKERMKNS